MISQKLQYFIYGSLLSASLITLTVGAVGSNGVFGDYFTNMIQDASGCGTNTALTGYNATLGVNYGKQECTTFQNIVKSVLGGSLAGPGKAVVGFDSATGNPVFGDVNWTRLGAAIGYMGGNVGIGTASPAYKLQVNHDDWAMVTRKADGLENSEPKMARGSLHVNDIYLRSIGKWVSDIGRGGECGANGLIGVIPDSCMNDGGPSQANDSLEAYCDNGFVRLCLSYESCQWRSNIYSNMVPGSRFGSFGDSAYTWCGNPTIRDWNFKLTGHY